ncbi:hypothetical protein EW146_g153 [Bondarzewia mesenterica]|uniref:DUF7779 domain-containing protein n=1 Tax=Bondarzewia mesenterica TaxID=1095465 RepID=A0A4S4M8H4_9AGAM|nr:hypothetical protein EW146_g153 [Bondarzewia mesenterica]
MLFATFSKNTPVAPATSSTPLADAVIDISSLIANIAKGVGNAAGCTPASIAASIIVKILASLKAIKSNKEACRQLALRAACFWIGLRDRMEGKWKDAHPALVADIEKFNGVLDSTRIVLERVAQLPWYQSLFRNSQITGDLANHGMMLEHAIQLFGSLSLIEIRYAVGMVSLKQPSMDRKSGHKRCPPPSDIFTGRTDILSRMHNLFAVESNKQRIYVLYGLGGAGKSQLTYKFVQECQMDVQPSRFSDVFFADASTADTIDTDLKNIALAEGIGNSAQDAISWLVGQCENWLLLFNNADDPSLNLRTYFPPCSHGNIIITSRNREMRSHATQSSQIADMTPDDATDLLLTMTETDRTDEMEAAAREIVKELGYLALAVIQAGAYMKKTDFTFTEYLELHRQRRADLLEEYRDEVQKPDDYEWTVYTTWAMSFKRLGRLAQEFLQICSFLHHEGISEAIFENATRNSDTYEPVIPDIEPDLSVCKTFLGNFQNSDGRWDTLLFKKVITEIRSYSLIDFAAESQLLSIHPLVHSWSQTTITNVASTVGCTQCILGVSMKWEFGSEDYGFRRRLLPHITEALKWNSKPKSDIASRFGLAYDEGGRWEAARGLRLVVMEIRQQVLGQEHPDTLKAMNNLASTLLRQGRWKDAELLQMVAMETSRRVLGEEHPETLTAMASLASIFRKQGRWKEAELLEEEVTETRQRVLGEDHPDTVAAMASLASTFGKQGRWKEARIAAGGGNGDESANAWRGASGDALSHEQPGVDIWETRVGGRRRNRWRWCHGQPGIDILRAGSVEEGGVTAGGGNGDETASARRGASRHAHSHEQPGIDILRAGSVEEGGVTAGGDNGDESASARGGAFGHAFGHGQPGVDILEPRSLEGGEVAAGSGNEDESASTRQGASRHALSHGQPGIDIEEPG